MGKVIIKLTVIIATIAGALLCAAFYSKVMLPNNQILDEYERVFDNLVHMPGTSHIATYGKVGWMEFPFPEACNFLVADARSYSTSEEEVREFYSTFGLVLEDDPPKSPVIQNIDPEITYHFEPLRLIFFERKHSKSCDDLITLQWSLSTVCQWANRKIEQEKFYVVYVTSPGYEPGYDPRCNFAGW